MEKLKFSKLDPATRSVLIEKRKHPRVRLAKDEWVPLLGHAWVIVNRQPRLTDMVFNRSKGSVSDKWRRACKALGIPNLHFHDLRREAASNLRELGFDKTERRAITGHSSDDMEERYQATRVGTLHEKFDTATKAAAKKSARKTPTRKARTAAPNRAAT